MQFVREVSIENYKSIRKLTVELGQVNVLVGANGSGKSNLLEAIAYGSAAARHKLDNEYLVPRGIRVTEPRFMRAASPEGDKSAPIVVSIQVQESDLSVQHGGPSPDFLIYAPESSALRVVQAEPPILPLGVNGEGLFTHLEALAAPDHADRFAAIGDRLALLDWFERIEIPKDLAPGERSLLIRDRYLAEGALFDQRSANEGFLFLLFYLTLFLSDATPAFFAIDNVDASLNPKLVTTLVTQLVTLAKERGKQVIFTTHNPAVLDGLDLGDDEQRLFVTERGRDGATRVRRVAAPKPLDGEPPVALSEAFVRGFLGGLPKNF
jgi:predicted ATPase